MVERKKGPTVEELFATYKLPPPPTTKMAEETLERVRLAIARSSLHDFLYGHVEVHVRELVEEVLAEDSTLRAVRDNPDKVKPLLKKMSDPDLTPDEMRILWDQICQQLDLIN